MYIPSIPTQPPPHTQKLKTLILGRDIEDKLESFEGKLEEANRMGRVGRHNDWSSKEESEVGE